jgi:hypothetical protein
MREHLATICLFLAPEARRRIQLGPDTEPIEVLPILVRSISFLAGGFGEDTRAARTRSVLGAGTTTSVPQACRYHAAPPRSPRLEPSPTVFDFSGTHADLPAKVASRLGFLVSAS